MQSSLLAAILVGAAATTCPDYKSLAQPSVSPDNGFTMKKLHGVWNIIATSEPTIPAACRQCSIINFSIYTTDYRYTTTASCASLGKRYNVSMNLGGHQGGVEEPGNCMENFVVFNHTVEATLMPNMFFNYTDDWYMSYACGKQFGLMDVRSFFLASRHPKPRVWIEEKIEWPKLWA